MGTCQHALTTPVDVRNQADGTTVTVAQICNDCLDQLPAAWGCTDCTWVEQPRRLSEKAGSVVLGRPCARHRSGEAD